MFWVVELIKQFLKGELDIALGLRWTNINLFVYETIMLDDILNEFIG